MKKKEIAFIGGGIDSEIGRIHYNAINLTNKFTVAAGLFSKKKVTNYLSGKNYNISKSRVYTNIDQLLKKEKNISAIVLLTPIPNRVNYIEKILKKNIPLISEKPLLSSYSEAKKILKISKNKFISLTYNYSGYPILRDLKLLIANKKLGKIKKIFVEMPSGAYLTSIKKNEITSWRLQDKTIPTVLLDLGSHVFNLIYFLLESYPTKLISMISNHGKFNVKDDLSSFGYLKNNIKFNVWFSKSAIGFYNGLKIRVFGDKGSAEWEQNKPEKLKFSTHEKKSFLVSRGDALLSESKKKRYNIFKPGHPQGFQEAFKFLYDDIISDLEKYKLGKKSVNKYTFDVNHAAKILNILEALCTSSKKNQWINIKQK